MAALDVVLQRCEFNTPPIQKNKLLSCRAPNFSQKRGNTISEVTDSSYHSIVNKQLTLARSRSSISVTHTCCRALLCTSSLLLWWSFENPVW